MNTDEPTIDDGSEPPRRRGRPPTTSLAPASPAEPEPDVTYRDEDPRTRAARRALELREHLGNLDQGTDEFYVDPRIIPDGWGYEWKRYTILGAQDPSYQVSLARAGWEAVPPSRHPEMMPDNYRGNTIERKGVILMERPLEIIDEVKSIEKRKARDQVVQKEQLLSGAEPGQFERDNKGAPLVRIKKSYESIPIPK